MSRLSEMIARLCPNGVEYRPLWSVTFWDKKFNAVDRNKQPIVDEEEMYSGVWAIVSVTFFPYDINGNKGVACGLNNLMKWKDDDHLGGRVSAEADFGDVDTSGEDDEDL